eukprot:4439110-Amphidinium_carterae.1
MDTVLRYSCAPYDSGPHHPLVRTPTGVQSPQDPPLIRDPSSLESSLHALVSPFLQCDKQSERVPRP